MSQSDLDQYRAKQANAPRPAMVLFLWTVGGAMMLVGIIGSLGHFYNAVNPVLQAERESLRVLGGEVEAEQNTFLWPGIALAGLLFAGLGSIIDRPSAPSEHSGTVVASETKKCPFCAELVKTEAIVCRFCGRDLPAQ
jgi:hypothetical protein